MPPSASSNLPRRSDDRAGERALHVAEQLALDQLLGNRGAVDLDERPGAPTAQRVDAARDELLAGAVLAVDQHAAVGRRRHRDLLAQLRHHVALADHRQPAIDVRAQRAVLRLEPALPHGVADDQDRLLERERLLDEVEGAHLDRAHGRLDVAVPGDHDHRRVDAALAQPRQRRQPVHARQPDVEHDDVVRRAQHAIEAGLAALDGLDGVALVAQHAAQRAAHAGLVVDDQDVGFHHSYQSPATGFPLSASSCWVPAGFQSAAKMKRVAGTGNWKLSTWQLDHETVPCGTLSVASMLPPCSAMIRRTIARPSPLPRRLVE